ncbi:hypothetical protein HED60_19325 [Planctomycetales bacterium ZRK34]|nr:hypothetical protein HED60_19325 [Planctomycetales bacterium ZRK34]
MADAYYLTQAQIDRIARALNKIERQRLNRGGYDNSTGVGRGRVQQFKVVSQSDDYITCNTFDGSSSGSDSIIIAKPYHLRQSTWDGETNSDGWSFSYTNGYTRTASKTGESDVDQVIEPAYTAGDIIYASRSYGGTNEQDGSSSDIVWIDINADARRWVFDCDA